MSLHLIRFFCSSLCTLFRSGRSGSVYTVTPQHVQALLKHPAAPLVLDVRNHDEFVGERGHIPGAVLCPVSELDTKLDKLKAYRTSSIVTVRNTEGRSVRAAQVLRGNGFTDVSVLAGGMIAWNEARLPVSHDPPCPAIREEE